MNTSIRFSTVVFALFIPTAAHGQLKVRVASVEPLQPINRCSVDAPEPLSPMWGTLMDVVTLDEDDAKRRLLALQDSAVAAADASPDDVDAQFTAAAVLGARAEVEGGRTKIHVAEALIERLEVVLELDPDHPGALDLMGRLHASVMRLNRFTRFVATQILGGDRLGSASWNEAERLLGRAAAEEPCIGDHRLQLARVYADQGKRREAFDQLRELVALGPSGSRDRRVWGEALELAEDLGSP